MLGHALVDRSVWLLMRSAHTCLANIVVSGYCVILRRRELEPEFFFVENNKTVGSFAEDRRKNKRSSIGFHYKVNHVVVNTACKGSPVPLACFQGGTSLCYLGNWRITRLGCVGSWEGRKKKWNLEGWPSWDQSSCFKHCGIGGNSLGCVDLLLGFAVMSNTSSTIGFHVLNHCLVAANGPSPCVSIVVSKIHFKSFGTLPA